MHAKIAVGALAVTLLQVAPAGAEEFNIQTSPMAHQFGGAVSNFWRATIDTGSTMFSTYGPSRAIGPYNGEYVAYTYFGLFPSMGKTLNATWDVVDGNTVIHSRNYSTQVKQVVTPAYAFRAQAAGSSIQVRTRHRAYGTIDQWNVFLLNELDDKVAEFWPAIDQIGFHEIGRGISAGDWIAGPGFPGCTPDCVGKGLSWGPNVVPGLTPGADHIAVFHLQTNTGAGSTGVLFNIYIRYWDSALQQYLTLASWPVKGTDVPSNNVMNTYSLRFAAPNPLPNDLDFTVQFANPTITLRQSTTKIFRIR
jgi:hypothetical protein